MIYEINTDEVSEKYKKYVIELLTSDQRKVYLLWGTDNSNQDFDYVFLNNDNYINAFSKIETLKKYLEMQEIKVDPLNTKQWAKEHNSNKPYSIYNLPKVTKVLTPAFNLNKLNQAIASDLLNFYNLFSDFAYQINDVELLKITKEKNTKIFFDFACNTFFWNSSGVEKDIKIAAKGFDNSLFVNNYSKMIKVFEERILIIKDF